MGITPRLENLTLKFKTTQQTTAYHSEDRLSALISSLGAWFGRLSGLKRLDLQFEETLGYLEDVSALTASLGTLSDLTHLKILIQSERTCVSAWPSSALPRLTHLELSLMGRK
eukprot:TRINITY_DN24603_c0_g1_i1.p1 TRINITY_DN24603_c0_g1~~TRINITY_DN24603_c0_g1_i1.p1  ORF type:complete len:113 (-),score=12.93 TRINITY_DN24603_c0_g1_i1:58-396(-)